MASGKAQRRTGSFVGTGAALTIASEKVGFTPKSVTLYNIDRNITLKWFELMDPDVGQKVVDSGTGATDVSLLTSNGITATATGFTVGTDSVNTAGDRVLYEVWG